jgi:hypothetical protein
MHNELVVLRRRRDASDRRIRRVSGDRHHSGTLTAEQIGDEADARGGAPEAGTGRAGGKGMTLRNWPRLTRTTSRDGGGPAAIETGKGARKPFDVLETGRSARARADRRASWPMGMCHPAAGSKKVEGIKSFAEVQSNWKMRSSDPEKAAWIRCSTRSSHGGHQKPRRVCGSHRGGIMRYRWKGNDRVISAYILYWPDWIGNRWTTPGR